VNAWQDRHSGPVGRQMLSGYGGLEEGLSAKLYLVVPLFLR